MIKLKDILKEISFAEPTHKHVWKTPPNAPKEVVDLVHDIVFVIHRDAPNYYIFDLMSVSGPEFDAWFIDKPILHGQRHWALAYYEDAKSWAATQIDEYGTVSDYTPITTPASLKAFVNKWVKDSI